MSNKLYQCSYCELSFNPDEERLSHEKECENNNNLTGEEKFKNRLKLDDDIS